MSTQWKNKKPKQPKKRTKKKNQETWQKVKAEIRPSFIEAGIRGCELRWSSCTDRLFLTFAHSMRRRKIDRYDGEERAKYLREVIRACQNCHAVLDSLEHEETTRIVREIIASRIKPVCSLTNIKIKSKGL